MSKQKQTISEKMIKLDELVAWFDGENFEIEAALEVFAEAKALAEDIEADLASVKNDINVLSEQFDRDAA